MITNGKIINQPYSGEFPERIYDYQNEWNSQLWSFIKFTDNDYSEWCGQFRGSPIDVAISPVNNLVLVLTSDILYELDAETGDLNKLLHQTGFQQLTVSPNGNFILADYYNLIKISTDIKEQITLESPIQMDIIKFKNWEGTILNFTCEELLNWSSELHMIYNCEDDTISMCDNK